jgi:NAD(P)-dependent dehydrogenase (short-subunit alcohol dehydrogenase family)
MSLQLDFGGRLAVVTGAGSGIGLSCARRLAAGGAKVAVLDRNLEAAEAAAREVGGFAVGVDVAEEQSVLQAAEAVRDHGTADFLVNCAGVLQRTLPPGVLSMREWDFVARVDLRGTYLCCAAFGTGMVERRRGAIVNIASVAGMRSGPLHSYAPAKAGVISLSECLAGEWGRAGVRVNCVSPGFTETPALSKGFSTGTLAPGHLTSESALGRLVSSDEVANAVAFLCSDLASAVTGVNLPVDAGYLVAGSWAAYGGLRELAAAASKGSGSD